MNKLDLTERLARQWHRSRAKAADEVDTLVHKMLKDLKRSAEKESSQAPDRSSTRQSSAKDRQ